MVNGVRVTGCKFPIYVKSLLFFYRNLYQISCNFWEPGWRKNVVVLCILSFWDDCDWNQKVQTYVWPKRNMLNLIELQNYSYLINSKCSFSAAQNPPNKNITFFLPNPAFLKRKKEKLKYFKVLFHFCFKWKFNEISLFLELYSSLSETNKQELVVHLVC